jgi:alpha-beta hydrolase superfamily lysophospholipase
MARKIAGGELTVTVERHRVTLPTGALAVVLHCPGGADPVPCVVACHGLRASKESDKYLLLGEECARAGLALARFDFRGSGESEGLTEAETTVASRVDDVLAIVAFLRERPRLDGRFGLLGSSMGGFVALHARHALGDSIPVVTWNAPASLTKLAASVAFEDTGLGASFVAEFSTARYAAAPSGIDRHLAIQSEADETVPLDHGLTLHAQARDPRELIIIPAADHRITNPAHRHQAVAQSLAWFQKHFPTRAADSRASA